MIRVLNNPNRIVPQEDACGSVIDTGASGFKLGFGVSAMTVGAPSDFSAVAAEHVIHVRSGFRWPID